MSMIIEGIKKDQEELQSLFIEKLEFEFCGLEKTYTEHKLLSINGKPLDKNIIMYFYQDDIYIPFEHRDPNYKGTLVAFDFGGLRYAKYYYKRKLKKSEMKKLSIYEVIKELYTNSRRQGVI